MPDASQLRPIHPSAEGRGAAIQIVPEATVDRVVLADYARVAIAFTVRAVLDWAPAEAGLGGLVLRSRVVSAPYVKDYDALDGGPARWPDRFGATVVARWGVLAAYRAGESGTRRIGGAVVVHDDPAITLREGRSDLAVLWDLRVAPEHRGRGIGRVLFDAAVGWARARGARRLTVETQNVNVPACRFYAARGCTLGAIHRFAYPELPHEVQLLWFLDLDVP